MICLTMSKKSLILILFFLSLECSRGNQILDHLHRIRTRRELTNIDGDCEPPEIENGKFEVLGKDYVKGDLIPNYTPLKLTCKQYHALHPNITLINCINGNWQPESPLPKCIRTCPGRISTSVDTNCTFNGNPVDCTNPVLEGTVATSKCKSFYMSTDSTVTPPSTCIEGRWDTPFITCKPDCGEVISKGGINIVESEIALRGEFPWHIALYRNKTGIYKYNCGGSIITTQLVITAAHCLTDNEGMRNPPEEYYVGAGKFYSAFNAVDDTSAQIRQVTNYYIPSEYKGHHTNYGADIAVIFLKEAFTLTEYVRPVCTDITAEFERKQLTSRAVGSVAGWGLVDPKNNTNSEVLRKLTAPYIAYSICIDTVPDDFQRWVTQDKFCAGFTNGTSVCKGDSGGGLAFPWTVNNKNKYYLRGIVSVGPIENNTCDSHQYGVYTRVSHYSSFILDVIRENLPRDTRTFATAYGYCPEPEIENGKIDLLNAKYEEGFPIPNYSFMTIYCNEYYEQYPKTPYMLCVNGTWNMPMPECRKTCPCSHFVHNCKIDDIAVPCVEARLEGAEVDSECDESITSRCINGTWTKYLPSCLRSNYGNGGNCDNACYPSPCGPHSKCTLLGQNVPSCVCLPGYAGHPPECQPACVNNYDCPWNRACISNTCIPIPCPQCGTNANCDIIDHNPTCVCKDGFFGEPYIQCNHL